MLTLESNKKFPKQKEPAMLYKDANGPPYHVSTNSISQKESSPVDGVPVGMEGFNLRNTFLVVGATQTENIYEPVNDVSLFGQDENGHTMGLISSTSLNSAENDGEGKELKLIEKDGHGSPVAGSGNNKSIKSEPANSGDTSFSNAGGFSYLLQVDGQFSGITTKLATSCGEQEEAGRIFVKLHGPDIDGGLSCTRRDQVLRFWQMAGHYLVSLWT